MLNIHFNEYFELSLFRTSSEIELLDLVQDPVFLSELEDQKEKLLSNRKLQTVDQIPELSASPSTSVVSTSPPKFIPSIPQQPIITPQIPISFVSSTPLIVTNPSLISTSVSNPPRAVASRFDPLILPQNLDAMHADYQSKIPLFDATQGITTQQHVNQMNDFFNLHEIDEENVTMRLFVKSFGGEVRKSFRALPAGTINTLSFFIDNSWIVGR